ncbi:hypothetical protein CMUS01_10121 [Colletotrichum musicola]|uniref:Uncharacterized protein n=1 Tax=Colletotrichum musicola TaxID=2175873 RepID=A0A8H6K3Z5_9PEZI|nr:hypothetical protein CMUS01_10121 [Colletotrichum musicola]
MSSSCDYPDSSAPQPALSSKTSREVDAAVEECHCHFQSQINRHLGDLFDSLAASRAQAQARLIQCLPQRFPANEHAAIVDRIQQTFPPNLESFTYHLASNTPALPAPPQPAAVGLASEPRHSLPSAIAPAPGKTALGTLPETSPPQVGGLDDPGRPLTTP